MSGHCKFCYAVMENVDHDKWWCPECLKRKVKQARLGECRCGQVEGVHEHTAPPELTATEIQERRARENLDK